MTENREPNTALSKYIRQIRIAMITVFIIEFVVILIAVYKLRR
jgi:t-SNARE complex subunit (syntaxin)